jgi:hypothetical protein
MELLHRYSGLKQRMIAERLGGLDERLVSCDRRAICEKIELNRRTEGFRVSPGKVVESTLTLSGRAGFC